MEVENTQKKISELNVYKIPIEKYEEDMRSESLKEKKKEILDVLINYNNLHSEEEFKEIESLLHEACKNGDLELIKIYLCERIENDSKDMIFKIDKTNKTASLFRVNGDIEELTVPRTVKHMFTDYLITSILGTRRDIKIIKFVEDSAIKVIYNGTFSYSKIKEIYFPSSLKELKEGWCRGTKYLTKIIISPSNDKFIFKDDKYLLCKSDENNDEFDIFLFASRDINEISIPSNIKIISSYAFENCENLTRIEIPTNSNLETIKKNAFSYSKIEQIFIPPKVTKIYEDTFFHCENLTKVDIPTNSNLQIIELYSFYNLKIKEIFIPPKVSKIDKYAFYKCKYLAKIEIPTNSNLEIIESNAFSYSKIKEIYFPSSLKELKEGWCSGTKYLTKIIISPSNDKFIFKDDKYLLCKSDENNDEFDIFLFASRDINEISIPSNIKIISSYAFENCENLTRIEIPTNSNLETIEKNAFSRSKIKQIFIPSKISRRCGYSFYDCKNLIKVKIPMNDKKPDTFTKNELSIVPHIDVPVDNSAILSLSIYNTKMVIITRDYKAIVYNENEKYFEEKTIKNNDKVYFPISGFINNNYDLYIVSEYEGGIKTKLVKNSNFLNIGTFNPASIFCGSNNCAAIDLEGSILYIPNSYNDESFDLIEPKYLPNNEKAVDIACLSNFLYVLSSNGKLYISKNANTLKIDFQQVEQLKNISIVQISGILNHILVLTGDGKVYSKGTNSYGELGTLDRKDSLKKFYEITSLNKYKITAVSAGERHSLFLTSEGKVLACGDNESKQCFYDSSINSIALPVETSIQNRGEFCISSCNSTAVCIGFDPENSPNRRVKDERNIILLGCKLKTQILQAFINNKFVNNIGNENDEGEEDYIVDLEINKKVIKLKLIDAKDICDSDERNKICQQSMNFIYFFDNLDQSSSIIDEFNQIYNLANKVWIYHTKFALVNCINSNSSSSLSSVLKNNKFAKNINCKIFDVEVGKDIKEVDKIFYSFLPDFRQKDILKIGKDHRNPFNNINKDHINIGLFGNKNVNKTELAFRYIYDDLYKIFYDDFINNFAESNLDKIVECENNYFNISILDSTFVNNNEDNFRSCYSAVQGIVLVFQIDLLSSSDFIDEINHFYENAKDAVKGELNLIIALNSTENEQINDLYQINSEKIIEIEEKFKCELFLFSIENGENVENLFYFLVKKIVRNKKQKKKSIKKRKHHKKKKTTILTKYLFDSF